MNLKIEGKTAFISGSTAGIGFATAKSLAEEGAEVILNGRSEQSVKKAIEKLIKLAPKAKVSGYAADFTNSKSVTKLINQLPNIDILINNVGIYYATDFNETTDHEWLQQFEVNVLSGVRLSRVIFPKMLSKNWGRIIFISSECATLVPTDLIAYSASKAAILAISRGLAALTQGTAVTVNTVVPGSTLSEGAEQFLENAAQKEGKTKAQVEADFFKNVRTSSLIQRFATVEEIAHTITYLSSPLAAATNGATIKAEGGSMGGII